MAKAYSVSTRYTCNRCDYYLYGHRSFAVKEKRHIIFFKKDYLFQVMDENYYGKVCPACHIGKMVEDPKDKLWFSEKEPEVDVEDLKKRQARRLFPRYMALSLKTITCL